MVSESDIIFSLVGVSKSFPNRDLFADVSLSFLKGARIGVIGANGMGKSSLLKIMAGEDREFEGEVHWAPGARVVYVRQEPELDRDKTVRENVEDAVRPIRDKLEQFDAISQK
ncbi:MAG: ATP-binding cassette domain-containing protein, partial [Planctomycetota bacterium JB042]